jgi:hypothetical protein
MSLQNTPNPCHRFVGAASAAYASAGLELSPPQAMHEYGLLFMVVAIIELISSIGNRYRIVEARCCVVHECLGCLLQLRQLRVPRPALVSR